MDEEGKLRCDLLKLKPCSDAIFFKFDTVALSFVVNKHCLTMN